MISIYQIGLLLCLWVTSLVAVPASPPRTAEEITTEILAPLLDPAKIATLKGPRPINARFYRVMGWLESARLAGGQIPHTIVLAQTVAGYHGTPRATADLQSLRQSWKTLQRMGCFTAEGIVRLKRGRSPTIIFGKHAGDIIHVDHLLPRSVVPELDARFYNLHPVPSRINLAKGAEVGGKQLTLARRWSHNGLLSPCGLAAVEQQFVQGRRVNPIFLPMK